MGTLVLDFSSSFADATCHSWQCSLYTPVKELQNLVPLQVAHPSQNPAPAPGDEIEDYIIKCICGFLEDDGNTMYCDLCNTWQHTQCYYIDKHGNVPTKVEIEVIDHFCVDCQPRLLNYKGAIERQRTRREHLERNITTTATVEEQKKAGKSSYWSVGEQHACYDYIREFGTNWEAISTKLTTKTPQMVTISTSTRVTECTDWISRSRISTIARLRVVNLVIN